VNLKPLVNYSHCHFYARHTNFVAYNIYI